MSEIKINKLKKITKESIEEMKKHSIVLPSLYTDIFSKKALEFDIQLEDSLENNEIYNIQDLTEKQEQLSANVKSFSKNVEKAQTAIIDHNEEELKRIHADMEEMKKQLVSMATELYKDELTKIYNRKWLYTNPICENQKMLKNGFLVFIDLNDFKIINDSYGHIIGDKVLKIFAKTISTIPNSQAIRYAGDEFILLIEEGHQAEVIVKNLKNFFDEKSFKHPDGHIIKIKFSYGIQEFKIGESFKEILSLADSNMYKDKQIKKR